MSWQKAHCAAAQARPFVIAMSKPADWQTAWHLHMWQIDAGVHLHLMSNHSDTTLPHGRLSLSGAGGARCAAGHEALLRPHQGGVLPAEGAAKLPQRVLRRCAHEAASVAAAAAAGLQLRRRRTSFSSCTLAVPLHATNVDQKGLRAAIGLVMERHSSSLRHSVVHQKHSYATSCADTRCCFWVQGPSEDELSDASARTSRSGRELSAPRKWVSDPAAMRDAAAEAGRLQVLSGCQV